MNELTIAEIFRGQGYRTGVFGKWHLGHTEKCQPQNRGFDQSFVFYGNTSLQYERIDDPGICQPKGRSHDKLPLTAWTREGINALRENGKQVHVDGYLLWRFRDEAVKLIDQNKDQPFLLYLPINAPVPPLQAPRAFYDKLGHIQNENVCAYQALLLAYDDAVGAVLDRLKTLGLDKNTIVLFASDNGNAETHLAATLRFRVQVQHARGGIRTPYIVK